TKPNTEISPRSAARPSKICNELAQSRNKNPTFSRVYRLQARFACDVAQRFHVVRYAGKRGSRGWREALGIAAMAANVRRHTGGNRRRYAVADVGWRRFDRVELPSREGDGGTVGARGRQTRRIFQNPSQNQSLPTKRIKRRKTENPSHNPSHERRKPKP